MRQRNRLDWSAAEHVVHGCRQLDRARRLRKVDQDIDCALGADPRIDLDSFGHRAKSRFYATYIRHPARGLRPGVLVEPCAEVRDPALANLARDRCRLSVEPAVALAVAYQDFDIGIFGAEQLCPELSLARTPLA